MGQVIRKQSFETRKRHAEQDALFIEEGKKIPERYSGDIKRFVLFCSETDQEESPRAMIDYLDISLREQRVKKTTWERRLAAIKKYLSVTYGHDFRTDAFIAQRLSAMRKAFNEETHAEQSYIEGQPAADKQEVLDMIHTLPLRPKAITLVNLITANRPNEMVRLKVEDFNFVGRYVRVWLKKQKVWHNKRLTLEVIKVVKDYIKAYGLKPDDFFVGRENKGGVYTSAQIGEVSYNQAIQKWLGFAPYVLRKTQVSSMHSAGADLPTIAKQTGHRSLETLSKHYLSVSDSTVDQYL